MKNKGITLISLVITIIILIILASITTYSGVSTIKSSKFTKFGTELEIMQAQVNLLYEKYSVAPDEEKEQYLKMGEELTGTEEENKSFEGAGETDKSKYRYFTKEILENIDASGLEYEYLVNVEGRKVIALGGFEYERTKYYTLEQVKGETANIGGLEREEIDFSVNVIEKNKNGWEILISGVEFSKYVGKGKIQYKKAETESWRTLEDLAVEKEYKFTIKESGRYTIRVTDATGKYTDKDIYLGIEIGDYLYYNPTDELPTTAVTTYTSPASKTGHSSDQTFTITGSYDTSKYSWRILGVKEDGTITIISEDSIHPINGDYYYLGKAEGYENAIVELNNISKIYGQGYGAAEARSIKIEDIDKITGYNPNNVGVYDVDRTGVGKKFGENTIQEYENEIEYYWQGPTHPYYKYKYGDGILEGNHMHFVYYDENLKQWKTILCPSTATTNNRVFITKIKFTNYYYYPSTLTVKTTDNKVGIQETSKEYSTLFYGKNNTLISYWLASRCVDSDLAYDVGFEVRCIIEGCVKHYSLQDSRGGTATYGKGIRPVVTLKSDIKLKGSSQEGWTIVK